MKIEDLRPARGAKKRRKIIGRGPGSGHGKTSTRGHKGQMSRTGKGQTPGFEGGQMPIIRKIPKRGFNKQPEKGIHVVNLKTLSTLKKETCITPELLKKKGVIKGSVNFIKILGEGETSVPVNITAHAFSKTAMEKIKNMGGKCEIVGRTRQTGKVNK